MARLSQGANQKQMEREMWEEFARKDGAGIQTGELTSLEKAMGQQAGGASTLLPTNSISVQSQGPRDLGSVASS